MKIIQAIKSINDNSTHPILKIEVKARNSLIFFSLKILIKENITLTNAKIVTANVNPIEKIIFRITNFIGILKTQIIPQSKKLIKFKYQEWNGKIPIFIDNPNKISSLLNVFKVDLNQKYRIRVLAKAWITK